jgi:hypothetical protein
VSEEAHGPTLERFRDGWVVVDRGGTISTPNPMPEAQARLYAQILGIPLPEGLDARPPHLRLIGGGESRSPSAETRR